MKFLWGDLSWRLAKISTRIFDWHTDIFTVNYNIGELCNKSRAIKLSSTLPLSLWPYAYFDLRLFAILLSHSALCPKASSPLFKIFFGTCCKIPVMQMQSPKDRGAYMNSCGQNHVCLLTLLQGCCVSCLNGCLGVPAVPKIVTEKVSDAAALHSSYQQECKSCGLSWIWAGERTSPGAENCRANGEF